MDRGARERREGERSQVRCGQRPAEPDEDDRFAGPRVGERLAAEQGGGADEAEDDGHDGHDCRDIPLRRPCLARHELVCDRGGEESHGDDDERPGARIGIEPRRAARERRRADPEPDERAELGLRHAAQGEGESAEPDSHPPAADGDPRPVVLREERDRPERRRVRCEGERGPRRGDAEARPGGGPQVSEGGERGGELALLLLLLRLLPLPGAGVEGEHSRGGREHCRRRRAGSRMLDCGEQLPQRRVDLEDVDEREEEIDGGPELEADLAHRPREPRKSRRLGGPGVGESVAAQEQREADRREREGREGQDRAQIPGSRPGEEERARKDVGAREDEQGDSPLVVGRKKPRE